MTTSERFCHAYLRALKRLARRGDKAGRRQSHLSHSPESFARYVAARNLEYAAEMLLIKLWSAWTHECGTSVALADLRRFGS